MPQARYHRRIDFTQSLALLMLRSTLCLLLLVFVCALHAAPVPPTAQMPDGNGPWVVRAWYPDRVSLRLLTRRTAPWQVNHAEGYVVVEVANRYEYRQLLDLGFKTWIDPDFTRLLTEPASLRSIPGFACYRTVEETAQTLDQLVAEHPSLARLVTIGESWERQQNAAEGYELRVLVLGNQATPEPKPKMFVMGAVHAREYTTAELVTRFAEDLLADYEDDADVRWLLDTHELHVIPQSNPDGRKQAEAGLLWRKNVNQAYCGATSNARGADLNRNFPFEWGNHDGSSGDVCSSTYRGLSPASEPETGAIIDYVRSVFPDRRADDLSSPAPDETEGVFLDIHSFSELVIWPWGFTDLPAPNGTALATLGRRLAWFNGYTAQQAVDLYVTDGTTLDFAYGELGLPAFTFELGTAFFQNCDQFLGSILEPNRAALRYALRVSRRPYLLPAGPETSLLQASPVEPGETALFFAVADDGRFRQGAQIETSQRITAARIHDGALDGALVAIMSPVDGSFDSSREELVGVVDSNGRPVGRHLLVAQAEDESGAVGPGIGQWLEVVSAGTTGKVEGLLIDAAMQAQIHVPGVVRSGDYASLNGPSGYSIRLHPGTRQLRAEVAGYLPSAAFPVDVSAGRTSTLNLSLLPECELLGSDAEAGVPADWSLTFPWGLSDLHSVSPTRSFTDSPVGNYSNGANTAMILPALDLSAIEGLRLSFASRCDTEQGFDFGRLEYRVGEGGWVELWQCSGSPVWEAVDLDLSDLAGQAQVQLRFRITSDGFQTLDGWYLDDIRLVGGSLNCPNAPLWEEFADGFEGS